MKRKPNFFTSILILGILISVSSMLSAQDSTKNDLLVNVSFHNDNNEMAYVTVQAKTKIKGKFQMVNGAAFQVFLDKDSAGYEIGKLVTDSKGEASAYLQPTLQQQWNSLSQHNFIAVYDGDKNFNPSKTEASFTKARLHIDTGDNKTVTVKIEELKDGNWLPVKSVDIKVGIRRMGGDLAISDKESYSTDSTGTVAATFALDSIQGDKNGNLKLIAKVEDNDSYGNLTLEKTVHWGTIVKPDNSFNQRSLWATRFKTPIWLLFIAYSILISAWSVIIYLLFQLRKIKNAALE